MHFFHRESFWQNFITLLETVTALLKNVKFGSSSVLMEENCLNQSFSYPEMADFYTRCHSVRKANWLRLFGLPKATFHKHIP